MLYLTRTIKLHNFLELEREAQNTAIRNYIGNNIETAVVEWIDTIEAFAKIFELTNLQYEFEGDDDDYIDFEQLNTPEFEELAAQREWFQAKLGWNLPAHPNRPLTGFFGDDAILAPIREHLDTKFISDVVLMSARKVIAECLQRWLSSARGEIPQYHQHEIVRLKLSTNEICYQASGALMDEDPKWEKS